MSAELTSIIKHSAGTPEAVHPVVPAQTGLTLGELQSALLRVGDAFPDGAEVMRAACSAMEELTAMRSEMKVRAIVGRGHLSGGNIAEAMRMFDSIEKIAGDPGRRFDVLPRKGKLI